MASEQKGSGGSCGMAIAVVIGLILTLMANLPKNENKRSYDDTDVKIVARQRLKDQLRDPDSLQIISEEVIRPGRNGGVVGYEAKYRAKNGFGGYMVDTFYTE